MKKMLARMGGSFRRNGAGQTVTRGARSAAHRVTAAKRTERCACVSVQELRFSVRELASHDRQEARFQTG